MSDLPPPSSQPPPMHPAPPRDWKPLSGLAVTAFVLSLLFILLALFGYWIVEAVPLLLGIYTLTVVKRGQKRGRILALWAIVVSASVGTCAFAAHRTLREHLKAPAEAILSVLSSQTEPEAMSKSLRAWAWPEALEKDENLPQKWMNRYTGVVAEFGEWTETVDLPSIVYGSVSLFVAPEGVIEVGTEDAKPPSWTMGSAIWIPAVFEKGRVYAVVVLQDGDRAGAEAVSALKPDDAAAVVGDLRFFRSKAEKGP